jgi:hypothetical protein
LGGRLGGSIVRVAIIEPPPGLAADRWHSLFILATELAMGKAVHKHRIFAK